MADAETGYIAYLLRLWNDRTGGEPIWRCSLEEPQTGKRYGFLDVHSLSDFLWEQIRRHSGEPEPTDSTTGAAPDADR